MDEGIFTYEIEIRKEEQVTDQLHIIYLSEITSDCVGVKPWNDMKVWRRCKY